MVATDRMISYIRRDELTHVTLFAHILREIKKEFPEAYSEKTIREMTETAVNQEIEWSKHILGKTVIGMSPKNIEGYTKWLANKRLTMLGIKPLYSGFSENPYKHLELLQNSNSEKSNFFESSVSNYTQSSSIKGSWDF
jgi:ribonucleoside-diphosphate reductase beta chain